MLKMYKTAIPSDVNIICDTVNSILRFLKNTAGEVSEDVEFEIKVVLNELIINAIRHGNKENCNTHVKIVAAVTKDNKLLLVVEDEGQGYSSNCLRNSVICDVDLEEMKVSGRGLIIVTSLCERVKHNKKGNRIMVIKNLF